MSANNRLLVNMVNETILMLDAGDAVILGEPDTELEIFKVFKDGEKIYFVNICDTWENVYTVYDDELFDTLCKMFTDDLSPLASYPHPHAYSLERARTKAYKRLVCFGDNKPLTVSQENKLAKFIIELARKKPQVRVYFRRTDGYGEKMDTKAILSIHEHMKRSKVQIFEYEIDTTETVNVYNYSGEERFTNVLFSLVRDMELIDIYAI